VIEQPVAGEVTYHPYASDTGFLSRWREAFHDLARSKELSARLIVRDVTARYRQSFLGWIWAFFPGIATTFLFVYLRNQQIFQIRDPGPMPYPVYVLFGFTVWQVFAAGLIACTQSLTGAGHLLSKLNFPRESLVFSAMGTVLFDLALRCFLLAIVFLWFGVPVKWTVLFFPAVLIPLMILVLGLGFFLSTFNALIRDIGTALATVLGLFFFLVPVIYPPPQSWPQVLLNDYNPVAAILIAAHDVTVVGMLTRPSGFVIACLVSVVIYFSGWRIFRLAQPIVAERI
jgi:lipopolysaccharide transport system permease protein